jgi:glyoxylase-like metal-dependent hydrolase (beta-lactamase superfamily II)
MKILKKVLKWLAIAVGALVLVVGSLYFIYVRPVMQTIEAQKTIEYDDNLTIHLGGGGNTGVLVSDSLVIVIDTKMGDAAEDLASEVKQLAGDRPILAINTHYHIDHTGGNDLYAGQTVLAGGGYTPASWVTEAANNDMPSQWLSDRIVIKTDVDTVTILTLNMTAHTAGDVFVYLHNRKMLFGGDVILNGQVPSVNNGDPEGYLTAFDRLQKEFEIQTIIPGHGEPGSIEIMETFRQYFNDMKTAANDETKRDEMFEKYEYWVHVPLLMSSGNVVDKFRK